MTQPSSSYGTQTLTSLHSLRTRAHNLLRLAFDSYDRATQDRYLAAAREVLEQMEEDLDILDSMHLDTPEDALYVLERLGNGESDGDYGQQEEENGDEAIEEQDAVEHDLFDESGLDFDDEEEEEEREEGEDNEIELEEPIDNGTLHSSTQQDQERREDQGKAAAIITNGEEAYQGEWNARECSPDSWSFHSYAYEMMKFDRESHQRLYVGYQIEQSAPRRSHRFYNFTNGVHAL